VGLGKTEMGWGVFDLLCVILIGTDDGPDGLGGSSRLGAPHTETRGLGLSLEARQLLMVRTLAHGLDLCPSSCHHYVREILALAHHRSK
jgi:hypothetical protein